jgi:hypothetical protein
MWFVVTVAFKLKFLGVVLGGIDHLFPMRRSVVTTIPNDLLRLLSLISSISEATILND